jgi:hypothetical protein
MPVCGIFECCAAECQNSKYNLNSGELHRCWFKKQRMKIRYCFGIQWLTWLVRWRAPICPGMKGKTENGLVFVGWPEKYEQNAVNTTMKCLLLMTVPLCTMMCA